MKIILTIKKEDSKSLSEKEKRQMYKIFMKLGYVLEKKFKSFNDYLIFPFHNGAMKVHIHENPNIS